MIPLRDTLTLTRVPWINRALLATNIIAFIAQMASGKSGEILIRIFGFIPARFFDPARFGYQPFEVAITLGSSLFLHGGFVHLIGNMLYLAIFGNDVEEKLGHGRYLLFYLACGAAGSLVHAMIFPHSTIPSIGASGSIAGILGAFLLLHPRAKIITLFPLVISWALAEIPAVLFLPIWFLMQFANGFLTLASTRGTQEVAGVAWWAHIGGFSFGVVLALVSLGVGAYRARRRVADEVII